MRSMKDSGIQWLGEYPANWSLKKIKYCLQERIEKNNPVRTTDILSLTAKQGVIPYGQKEGGGNKPKEDVSAYRLAYPGDIVMNSMNILSGSVGLSHYFGCVSPVYYMLRPWDSKEDVRYYNYIFQTTMFQRSLYGLGNGILIKESGNGKLNTIRMRIPMDKFGGLFIPVASADEQRRIADFLDVKCTEIDALITDVQAQIDVLEQYKRSAITEAVTKGVGKEVEVAESRVFYLGPINRKWDLSKIGYICTKLTRSFEPEDTALICSNKGKVLVRDEKATGIMVSEDNAMQGIRKGDIAIHGMDTWHGAIALSEMDGKITRVVHVCDSTEDKRFVVYWLQHLAFQGVYKLISNGVRGNTSDFRSWDKVSDIYIPIPTRQEQAEICDYLDHICKEVDVIVETKKNQLTVLEAYKKSLIFEYATGKKEVPPSITAVMVDPNVILLGKLPKLLSKQKGKIYNQKVLYLLNTFLGLNLGVQYYRYKHGPYDIMLDSYIDTLVENGWCVKTINNGAENLETGPNYGAFEEEYGSYFSEYDAEINSLIQFVQPMKRSQIERVATLFAVWNDMILDGNNTPTDAEIVSEVMSGWTENKANFAYDTWLGTLNKMRTNGIIPKGQGLHTLPRDC